MVERKCQLLTDSDVHKIAAPSCPPPKPPPSPLVVLGNGLLWNAPKGWHPPPTPSAPPRNWCERDPAEMQGLRHWIFFSFEIWGERRKPSIVLVFAVLENQEARPEHSPASCCCRSRLGIRAAESAPPVGGRRNSSQFRVVKDCLWFLGGVQVYSQKPSLRLSQLFLSSTLLSAT